MTVRPLRSGLINDIVETRNGSILDSWFFCVFWHAQQALPLRISLIVDTKFIWNQDRLSDCFSYFGRCAVGFTSAQLIYCCYYLKYN